MNHRHSGAIGAEGRATGRSDHTATDGKVREYRYPLGANRHRNFFPQEPCRLGLDRVLSGVDRVVWSTLGICQRPSASCLVTRHLWRRRRNPWATEQTRHSRFRRLAVSLQVGVQVGRSGWAFRSGVRAQRIRGGVGELWPSVDIEIGRAGPAVRRSRQSQARCCVAQSWCPAERPSPQTHRSGRRRAIKPARRQASSRGRLRDDR